MAKIDKTGDAAIMPLHKILMKMCGQTGYTPDAVFEGLLDYIIMLALCAGIVVMNYKLNGQPRKEQVYNYKKGLYSAIILAVLTSLIYWL